MSSPAAQSSAIDVSQVRRGSERGQLLALFLSDCLAVGLAATTAVLVRYLLGGAFPLTFYLAVSPALILILAAYAVSGLYSTVALHPAVELQAVFHSTTISYILLAAVTFFARDAEAYSRAILLSSWGLNLFTTPLSRLIVRRLCRRARWWGQGTLIIGAGPAGQSVATALRDNPAIGLRVIGMVDDWVPSAPGPFPAPYWGPFSVASQLAREAGIKYAIIALPGLPSAKLAELIECHASRFPTVLIIPDLFGISSVGVEVRDLGDSLGVAVRHRLLYRLPQVGKRLFDLTVSSAFMILLLPLFVTIVLLIRMSSPGPALYAHRRLGRHGKEFMAWKFRSMVGNGDEVLEQYLREHPALRAEWEQDHKLRNDPRVTPIGRFLRKTSLDELPQCWNVLRGEMSLVGPRPIVEAEISRYGAQYTLYKKVRPGLSGLWQVSGRNNTTYAKRVALDEYYVRNWSIWFDIYILCRTITVVLTGHGAY